MNVNQLTGAIIGAAIEVHKILGPGLLEFSYEETLCYELTSRSLIFERQKPIPLVYKNVNLDCGYRLDLLVERQVIVELKSVESLSPIHEAVMLTYLKLSGHRVGLLLNFNVTIMKDGVRRFVL
jgi:GxxExxY protein